MTDKDRQFLHDALEYLAKNQIELNYTFPNENPTTFDDFPFCPELDDFVARRPRMEDLFMLCGRLNNGYYDRDCGAYLYDFVVFEEDVEDLYNAISADDELFDEFVQSLCYDDYDAMRDFVHYAPFIKEYIEQYLSK